MASLEPKKEELTRGLTSPVWSYFKVCEENAVWADCLLCGTRMSRGGTAPNRCGTTNLRRHVLYSHNINLPTAKGRGNSDTPRKVLRKKKSEKKSVPVSKKNANYKKAKAGSKKKAVTADVKKSVKEVEKMGEELPPADPVMCIKWNTYVNNMTSALPLLLNDERFVDVTLACEGQSLKCHKILLAACSPYFYELLSDAACRHPIIVFKDYHFWELQALVAFMYCGEVNVPQSQLARILRVAEALQIKGLAKPASKTQPPQEEEQPVVKEEVTEPAPTTAVAAAVDNKRKRKPSSHSCCKNPPNKIRKHKHVIAAPVKPKAKVHVAKKKVPPPPSKKHKYPSYKKQSPRKVVTTRRESKERPDSPSPDEDCPQLPDLPSDMPDMLSDILATAGMTDGISLPAAQGADGIFPLQDLEGMKMAMDEDSNFLANGLNHDDHFDLLPDISPECRLDEDDDDER